MATNTIFSHLHSSQAAFPLSVPSRTCHIIPSPLSSIYCPKRGRKPLYITSSEPCASAAYPVDGPGPAFFFLFIFLIQFTATTSACGGLHAGSECAFFVANRSPRGRVPALKFPFQGLKSRRKAAVCVTFALRVKFRLDFFGAGSTSSQK